MERSKVRELMEDVEAALKPLEAKYGVKLTGKRATYGESSVAVKVEFSSVGAGGEVVTREAEDLKRYGESFGLPKDSLGKEFEFRGQKYTVKGLAMRSRRFPVLAERRDGKGFKFPVNAVRKGMGLEPHSAYGDERLEDLL
jgi:hypothetical protein